MCMHILGLAQFSVYDNYFRHTVSNSRIMIAPSGDVVFTLQISVEYWLNHGLCDPVSLVNHGRFTSSQFLVRDFDAVQSFLFDGIWDVIFRITI